MGHFAQGRILAAFAAIYVLWGSTYLAVALGLRSIPPFLLMGARSLIGGAVLLAVSRFHSSARPSAGAWAQAALGGVLLFVGCHGVLAYAQQKVPSGIAAVVLATIPFWLVLLNFVAPVGRRPSLASLLGLIPGFAGVALIGWREVSRGDSPIDPVMIVLLVGAALSWAAGSAVSQRHAASAPPVTFSGMQLVCGGTVLLLVSALRGEIAGFAPLNVSAVSLAGLAYLTFAGTVVAFAAYVWLLDNVSGSLVATYTFINPVIAVILGCTLLDERLSPTMLAGMVLVVGSVVMLWRLDSPASR